MQPNATELKVSPRLATPDEAKRGHGGLISALVARSEWSQTEPNEPPIEFHPETLTPNVPAQTRNPLALWERARVRVPPAPSPASTRGMSGN